MKAKSRCAECGTDLLGEFCHACGLRAESWVQPLPALTVELKDEFVAVDRRFLRTAAHLIAKPGLAASEYAAGRRHTYTSPIRLLLLAVVAFAFIYEWFSGELTVPLVLLSPGIYWIPSAGAARFDFLAWAPIIGLLIAAPCYALGFHVYFWRRGALYARDLVFALYLVSFLLPLSAAVEVVFGVAASSAVSLFYGVVGLAAFYRYSILGTLLRAIGATVLIQGAMIVGLFLVLYPMALARDRSLAEPAFWTPFVVIGVVTLLPVAVHLWRLGRGRSDVVHEQRAT